MMFKRRLKYYARRIGVKLPREIVFIPIAGAAVVLVLTLVDSLTNLQANKEDIGLPAVSSIFGLLFLGWLSFVLLHR